MGVALAAGQGAIVAQQIQNRAIMRADEVLEAVPGSIITQHSGEGKANQYDLRVSWDFSAISQDGVLDGRLKIQSPPAAVGVTGEWSSGGESCRQ